MTTDLVPVDYAAEIERAADPGEYVMQTLERAKTWLAQALDHGDIEQIVELKSAAEAIRIYTMSKQLGRDSQLAATEIVRRAERGLGVAIRRGQEMGEIARRGSRREERQVSPERNANAISNVSPLQFASRGELSANQAGIYQMTDGVSDEEFEAALTEARAEGNLSRINLVRKVRKEEKPVVAPVRQVIGRASAQRRAITAACTTLSGISMGLAQIDGIHPDITSEEAAEWIDGLSEARREIERVIKRLKERVNSVPQA